MSTTDTPATVNGHARPAPTLTLVKEQPAPAVAPPVPVQPSPMKTTRRTIRITRALVAAVRHDRTRTAARFTARHVLYVAGGTRIITRRAWDARTTGRFERMMRTAEAAGNIEEIKEWEERAHRFREARNRRHAAMLSAMRQAPKAAAAFGGTGIGLLLLLGAALAWENSDFADVVTPLLFVVSLIRWALFIGSVVWGLAKMALPAMAVVALWHIGQARQAAPRWALPTAVRGDGEPITPSVVVLALRHLGVAPLRKAILTMEDAGASMLSPIAIAGCGVEVDVTLPLEVSTQEIIKKRRKLAENLGRHEHEVYISVAPAARTVRLWIADAGALDEPIPASPLVTDPSLTADYKTGRAPWGFDLRGDAVLISLYQKMVLVTGLSNQGKTASLRALALWLALDPTVEFRIGDLKGIGDWDMFRGLATTLIEGPTDDHVMDVTEMVEGVFDEMQRRLLAPKGTVFTPLVCIVDEAQVAYGCGAIGPDKRPFGGAKALSRYFRAVKGIHDQGRAVDVEMWEGTQDPTDQNLPKRSREGNHIRAALVLGTESQSAMALGENPVKAGAAPHKLRQGLDKGQLVAAGEGVPLSAGQVSVNIRTHYIPDADAVEIADRAKARRSGVTTEVGSGPAKPADHLADILTVIGAETRMLTQEVLQRLTVLNPAVYRQWNFPKLKAFLEPRGAEPYKSNGVMVVGRDRVLEAIEERTREAEEGDVE